MGFPISDPLDKVMAVLALILSIAVGAVIAGHGLITFGVLGGLWGLAYIKAPSRSFPTAEDVTSECDLSGKNVVITGPTSGIGVETARTLALRGAHVIMVARSASKLVSTKEDIETDLVKRGKAPPQLTCVECDLNDLKSVKAAADKILAMKLPLHLLINNAGIMALPERKSTQQNLESQVGVCHVAHFLLTRELLPALKAAAPSRIICLSSSAHKFHAGAECFAQPQLETVPYQEWVAYGNAKCANLLHAKALNSRFSKDGVSAFSVMPGGIHTGLQDNVDLWTKIKWLVVTPFFFKSVQQGAATTMVCATKADPKEDGGKYFENCQATNAVAKVDKEIGEDAAEQLWNTTEQLLKELKY